jgi:hypothetical protein
MVLDTHLSIFFLDIQLLLLVLKSVVLTFVENTYLLAVLY